MRNTDINSVIFPVDLKPVYVNIGTREKKRFRQYAGHRAVVNRRTGYPMAIVSDDYRLVPNELAIEYGKKCVSQLFPSVDPKNIDIFNIVTPSTGSYCYIDLLHKGYEINILHREVYIPFVRVSNSYNRTRALRFMIGFCRKICDNGLIFETETIKFEFPHTKNGMPEDIRFEINKGRMKELETEFQNYMKGIRDLAIPPVLQFPNICKALGRQFPIDTGTEREREDAEKRLDEFRKATTPLIRKYVQEQGSNAYAIFQALTHYASNQPEEDRMMQLNVPSMQRKAGAWLHEMVHVSKANDFSWEKYLNDYLKYAKN